jgi:hypothetical protein
VTEPDKIISALQHRCESVETELRETAGELEKATALLARIVKYTREDRATTPGVTRLARALAEAERLPSRDPAQPAAPTPDACPRCDDPPHEGSCVPCHEQPAAPTPEECGVNTQARESGCVCHWEVGDSPCPVHGEDEQPAAPEPSADTWEKLATERHRDILELTEENCAFRREKEDAEAQLAAVRRLIDEWLSEDTPCDLQEAFGFLERIESLLTPAPSPGAGEKT